MTEPELPAEDALFWLQVEGVIGHNRRRQAAEERADLPYRTMRFISLPDGNGKSIYGSIFGPDRSEFLH